MTYVLSPLAARVLAPAVDALKAVKTRQVAAVAASTRVAPKHLFVECPKDIFLPFSIFMFVDIRSFCLATALAADGTVQASLSELTAPPFTTKAGPFETLIWLLPADPGSLFDRKPK